MPRKLKTYLTSQGFYDLAIAAPSMKAALEAWGASSNLFHEGFAKEADDDDVIACRRAGIGGDRVVANQRNTIWAVGGGLVLTRIVLLAHWTSDVVAGLAVGAALERLPVRDWIRAALTKKDRNACSPRLFAIVITESTSMHHKSIEEISKRMAGIDIAILSTHTEGGQIANRPMSNNGDVEYDGTSYYFTFEQARTVVDIQANPKVALGFTGEGGIFSDAIYVAIEGNAELIRDKTIFKAHWTSDLDRWFDKGVDTPNIVLIKVKANRIAYWDGEEEGEVQV